MQHDGELKYFKDMAEFIKKSLEEKVHLSKLFSNYFKELYGIITQLRYGS